MFTKMFAIYDSKACFYGVPFFRPTTGAAVRDFSDLANDPQSSVSRHPGDYSLFHIGNFDDQDASLKSVSPQVMLGHGSDFVVRKPVGLDAMAAAAPVVPVQEAYNGGK